MRKTLLAVISLAVALPVQLVLLNGLHLPGGGIPDLVLVLVAALAVTGGPVRSMVTGFAAGLALDLAPPGSAVLGEYALTFCLVGWAAGKLSRTVERSALRALITLAVVVAAGEALAAGLGLALDPAQLSVAQVRQILPSAIGYDLLTLPFVLYLALLGRAWAAAGRLDSDLDPASAFAAPPAARPQHKPPQRVPHLGLAAARPHDGWVGSGPTGRQPAARRPAAPRGLRPGHGVAGSSVTGGVPHPALAAAPVNLRFDGRRRGFGVLGNPVGAGLGRHPGQGQGARLGVPRPAGSRGFRPHAGVPGGSAAGQSAALLRRPGRRPVSVKFGPRRKDASIGRLLGTPRPAGVGRGQFGPVLLDRTGRSVLGFQFRRTAALRFRSAPMGTPRSRPKAAPRFRHAHATTSTALAASRATGGLFDQRDLLAARRRQAAAPRLRLAGGRRGDGLLGGSAHGLRRSVRPGTPRLRPGRGTGPRRPRFGYGRRSVLSFLVAHRIGGRWLASKGTGRRADVWLIGRRAGGTR